METKLGPNRERRKNLRAHIFAVVQELKGVQITSNLLC